MASKTSFALKCLTDRLYYYREEIVHFEREFVEAQQAASRETAIEDDEIQQRMDRGRRALWQAGRDDAGPYQSPMEDAMVTFTSGCGGNWENRNECACLDRKARRAP